MAERTGFLLRDFSGGVKRNTALSTYLIPKNSASHSMNINYDTTVGNATVRPGTTLLGTAVASGKSPIGFTEFETKNSIVAVYKGATTASIYYYDTSWHTSGLTTLDNTSKVRFAVLGSTLFMANGVDAMKSSTDANTWGTTNCMTVEKPSLLISIKNRLLASGDPSYKSRVWFSSIIDPATSPFITWNENTSTGDFIDVNPDDGYITGFSKTSSVVLIFKNNGMYRLNTTTKTTDPQNIFNIGAVSQESIVECQGVTYFFSGQDIRRTSGDLPEQISRLVQDYIDAIPQANWSSVCAGTDGFNVYFSIGNITVNTNKDNQTTYNNVVLKFSPRDENWSVHSYYEQPLFYTQFTSSIGRKMVEACIANVQTVNYGTTDNGNPIFYELITQEMEFDDRASTKNITDKIVCFLQNGKDSTLQIQEDDKDFKDVNLNLNQRVAVGRTLNYEGNYFTFRWYGNSSGTAPVLEGIYVPTINDGGIEK